ncbi:MAG: cysteine desulfurase [Ferrovum sp.]|nr:cysteine desulfurase [Ferrovum sp.]
MHDILKWRAHFPILQREIHGKPLVYLDNAATTQKPLVVLEAERHYYEHNNANIHRGVHQLSQEATDAYEGARDKIQHFLGAANREEIIMTRGATEAINLVAYSWGRQNLQPGDEIVLSEMEHHANIVPWQMAAQATGAQIKVIPIDDSGALVPGSYEALLSNRTKIVAITWVSNALGTVNPVASMIQKAHEKGAVVLIDAAQAVAHEVVDVKVLDCDFLVFSGHKIYAPTGTGVLYGKRHLLERMPPWQGGGDMIAEVTFAKTIYNELPYKFEAGTPHIAGVVGLGAAIDFVHSIGLAAIAQHEGRLLDLATRQAKVFAGLQIVGTATHKVGVLSFVMPGIHPHDIGTILDQDGIAIRTGHHCAMPVMDRYQIPATARASFAFYNTEQEVLFLFEALQRVQEMFRP